MTEMIWPPDLEVYCKECRRLVAGRTALKAKDGSPVTVPDAHFIFTAGPTGAHSLPCDGRATVPTMRSGMEDPKAASKEWKEMRGTV